MPWSGRAPLFRSSSCAEVGVRRMDDFLKRKRPAVAVECVGRGEGRSVRPVVQEVGMITNLNCKLMDDDDDDASEGTVFTLGMDIYERDNVGGGGDQSVDCSFGGFLKNCSYCKRRLMKDVDVYMYGYLKAFCSPDCREEQIWMDERLRPPSPEPSQWISALAKSRASNAANIPSSESGDFD